MKPSHVSPTLLVLIYLVLVIVGMRSVLLDQLTPVGLVGLVLNIVILFALFLVGGSRARTIGISVSWLRIALGFVLILLGLWEIVSLSLLNGLLHIGFGALAGIGLGYWTITVLSRLNVEASQ